MSLTPEQKSVIVEQFQQKEGDTGSTEVQIALLTNRINGLTEHFKKHSTITGFIKIWMRNFQKILKDY